MAKNVKYMVMFVDEDSAITVPYGLDQECEGALQSYSKGNPPVIFESRSAASQAIKISVALAKLQQSQGVPHNDDFIGAIGSVKIVPVVMHSAQPQGE